MTKITPQKLAVLLDIKRNQAREKIIVCLERTKGNDNMALNSEEHDYDKDPSVDCEVLSNYMGIDFELILKDIKENYLKKPSTKMYIMAYPETKLKPNKMGVLPRSVSVPAYLKSMLKQTDIDTIVQEWQSKYEFYTKEYGVIFK